MCPALYTAHLETQCVNDSVIIDAALGVSVDIDVVEHVTMLLLPDCTGHDMINICMIYTDVRGVVSTPPVNSQVFG